MDVRKGVAAATLLVVGLGGAVVGPVVAVADQPMHEVPTWMRQECRSEDSVNCYWPGGSFRPDQGEMYVRRMPGGRLVCVFYVSHPRRDYCERIH